MRPHSFETNGFRVHPNKNMLLEYLHADLDAWVLNSNMQHIHQGKMCCSCIPMESSENGNQNWQEKLFAWT